MGELRSESSVIFFLNGLIGLLTCGLKRRLLQVTGKYVVGVVREGRWTHDEVAERVASAAGKFITLLNQLTIYVTAYGFTFSNL